MQISEYVSSVGQVAEAHKPNDQKVTTKYFEF